MFKKILLAVLSTAALSTCTQQQLPVFRINLLDAPEDRFRDPITHFKPQIDYLLNEYLPYFPSQLVSLFDHFDWLIQWYHPDKYAEIAGMSKIMGVENHIALMVNYVYEFESFCTSLIARQQDGLIIHMRMLDFDFPEETRNITYIAQFYEGEAYKYDAVMFGGLAAMQTGFKRNAFSISINQREPSDQKDWVDWLQNAGMIFLSYNQAAWLIRDTLEQCEDYACAFEKLSQDTIIAPAYYIVAGTKEYEGAIIARDRFGAVNITTLDENHWYLVQTNQDHFAGDCPTRCQAAHANFEKLGLENLSVERMYSEVLDVYPNLNHLSIHSSIMIPSQGSIQSQLVWGPTQATVEQPLPTDFRMSKQ